MTQAVAQIVVDLPEPAAPQPHTHAIADVDGLADAMAGKAPADHTHPLVPHRHDASEIDNLPAPPVIQPPEPSDWGPVIQSGIGDALLQGRFYHAPPGSLHVETPIHVEIGAHSKTYCGVIGDGTIIDSAITGGLPVLTLNIGANGINADRIIFEKVEVKGSGQDGDGLVFRRATTGSWLYNWMLRDVTVRGVGGKGIVWDGNVFEAGTDNCHLLGNGVGLYVGSSAGGIISTLRWNGGAIRKNKGKGAHIDGPSRGVSFHGTDFIENGDVGLDAENGCEGIDHCSFENNCQRKPWGSTTPRAGARITNYLKSAISARFPTLGYIENGVEVPYQEYGMHCRVITEMRIGAGTYATRTVGNTSPKFGKFENFGGGSGALIVTIGKLGLPVDCAADLAWTQLP